MQKAESRWVKFDAYVSSLFRLGAVRLGTVARSPSAWIKGLVDQSTRKYCVKPNPKLKGEEKNFLGNWMRELISKVRLN